MRNSMENILPLATLILPVLVTIIGFIVNYFTTMKKIENEIKKEKKSIAVTEMNSLLTDIICLIVV